MSQGKVVDTKPTAIALESGTYDLCSCGLFCDGSHQNLEDV
jgi:CDGSH-type Zn-finger protein